MPIHQAAAIWTLVFLIGLTSGELLRQQTLDTKAVAMTRGLTEPTAATSAPRVNPAALSATSMSTATTSPRQPATTVGCARRSCPDPLGKQALRTD
ncbi:MAG TPA: hypothetical protein VIX41_10875, partial [Acidimicrobiales bacterium]